MYTAKGRLFGLLTVLALGALVLAGCTSEATATTSPGETGGTFVVSTGIPSSVGGQEAEVSMGRPLVAGQSAVSYPTSTNSAQSGIWVTGNGKVTVAPDLVLLNLGVEAREATVSAARASAADAMTRVIATLNGHDIAEEDIRTRYFSIQPITVYEEKYQNGRRYNEPRVVGYQVSNQISVKVRDLGNVGPILDDAVAAGGDLIRVQGISFTVEDPLPYAVQAREAAVRDALAKAQQFATLTNVALGKLVYITETGGTPAPRAYTEEGLAMAAKAADVTTPIGGGEMEVTVSIQAVFAIP